MKFVRGLFDQIWGHFSLIRSRDNSWLIVAERLHVPKINRLMNLLRVKRAGFWSIFFITVIELMSVNSIRILKALRIHLDIFFIITP